MANVREIFFRIPSDGIAYLRTGMNPAEYSHRIVFILGPPRSGTTLLQSLLIRNQPRFTGSRFESQLYNMHRNRPYDFSEVRNHTFYRELLPEKELEEIFTSHTDYLSFFTAVTMRACEKNGKEFFSEKYPIHTLWHREIARDFPASRWILITRNPVAGVHSYATTTISWWRIWADGLPFGMHKWKFIRYLNACWIYYSYFRAMPKVMADPHCVLSVEYEDLVEHPESFAGRFEKAFGFALAKLDPQAPASSVSSSGENSFRRENLDAWKNQMPRWAVRMTENIFFPQRGFRMLSRALLLTFVIYPVYGFKQAVNAIRGQRT